MNKTEILSNEYKKNKRLCTQIVTYNMSDDLQMLADVQRRIENVQSEMERETDPGSKSRLTIILDELTAERALQQSFVDGYPDEE